MVVAPEAIVEGFFEYRLKDEFSFTAALFFSWNIRRVLRSTPMSTVTLEAIAAFPVGSHDLRIIF
jgi:hypothetical protein